MNYYGYFDGIYGVKTGFTGNAGRCLVSACKKGTLDIIVVVLGAGTKKQRTVDSINLINYAFNNFEMKDLKGIIDSNFFSFINNSSKNIKLKNSNSKLEIEIESLDNYIIPVNKKFANNLNTKIYTLSILEAPIADNTKIGVLTIYENENILLNLDIYLAKPVNKNSILENFKIILKSFAYI